MRASVLTALLAVASGCTPESNLVRDSAERFELELVGSVDAREQDGDKVLYRSGAITVALQRVRPHVPGRPSLEEVSDALTRRYANGEVEGSLTAVACTVAAEPARCVDGHIVDDGNRVDRRGFLVEDGDDVLLVEVIGDAGYDQRIDAELERAKQSFHRVEG